MYVTLTYLTKIYPFSLLKMDTYYHTHIIIIFVINVPSETHFITESVLILSMIFSKSVSFFDTHSYLILFNFKCISINVKFYILYLRSASLYIIS